MVEQNDTKKSCFQIKQIESKYKFIWSTEHYNKYYTLIVLCFYVLRALCNIEISNFL